VTCDAKADLDIGPHVSVKVVCDNSPHDGDVHTAVQVLPPQPIKDKPGKFVSGTVTYTWQETTS